MKSIKRFTATILAAVLLSFSFQGCYGGFVLFHKIHKWNGTIGDKWVKSIVHAALWILPVYGFCMFIDLIILNTVEFWTGSNPLAMQEGQTEEQIVAQGDETYRIQASRNRWDVECIKGAKAGMKRSLVFVENENAWYVEGDNMRIRVMTQDQSNPMNVNMVFPDGHTEAYDLSEMSM